jgi:tetratricopeptide (TPR) repeat protein
MGKPGVFLPKDLLERVQGVESGLKRGKNIEKAGWAAFLGAAGSVVIPLATTKSWEQVPFIGHSNARWAVIAAVAGIVVIVMLINWTRIWVRASRKSFRYTYSIAPFVAIAGSESLPRSASASSPDSLSSGSDGQTIAPPADATVGAQPDVGIQPGDGATDEAAQPTDEGTVQTVATDGATESVDADARTRDSAVDVPPSDGTSADTGDATSSDAVTDTTYPTGYSTGADAGYPTAYPDTAPGVTPLSWLVQDLSERLSRRIGRLSLLDEQYSDEPTAGDSHIHIGGTYGVRENADGVWNVEVLPWVRIGQKKSPATVAHLVKFSLGANQSLTPEAYEKLLERLYFSVASHLYGRIRSDVGRKIDLLPKRYFRASAYFHEARDYARSNTLDAYEQARELYAEVIRLYDPSWWHFSGSRARRTAQHLSAWWLRVTLKLRAKAARFWPRFGRAELMVAQAEIGYAGMVLNRRTLAGMSGQRLNAVFEARPVAESALERLGRLEPDSPGWGDTWFNANVTLAASHAQLGSTDRAGQYLETAKEHDPARAQADARYLHVHGQVVETRRSLLDLRRAVELDSAFDVAQYDLASALEMTWRARPTLERDVAEVVRDEYERVLTVNPGNISAWGNLGYLEWLLGDLDAAARVFQRGREYKEIKRETFVSELDYGLARIAAERGNFNEAYRRYIDAAGARFGEGVAHNPGYTTYHFARVTRAVVRRFEAYRDSVRKTWEQLEAANCQDPSQRVRNAVYAFVLNDYAEACLNYFLRSGNRQYLDKAKDALVYAEQDLKATYPMIYFNLHRILSVHKHAEPERVGESIERVVELEPDWVDGKLERSLWYVDVARRGRQRATKLAREAKGFGGDAVQHRAQADVRRKKGQSALFAKREQSEEQLVSLLRSGEIEGSAEGAGASGGRGMGPDGGQPSPGAPPGPDLPLPLTTPFEDEVAASQLDQEADTFHQQAEDLRESAETELALADQREEDALAVVRELLPHAWLWKEVDGEETIDLSAFDNPDFIRTRRWERELDDVNVRALVMWCRLDTTADVADRARVLEFVREHFLPADYDVLTECSKLVRGGDHASALRGVVRDWVDGEHAWWSLRRVTDGTLFDPADAAELLVNVARTDRGLPDGLFLWLAGELDRLGNSLDNQASKSDPDDDDPTIQELAKSCRIEAEKCHRRVRQSPNADASVLFKLGNVLNARGDDDAAHDAYLAAEKIDKEDGYSTFPPETYRRAIGVPLWKLGHYKEALAELAQIDDENFDEPWRDKLVCELVDCGGVATSDGYRLLKDWLGRVLTAHRADEDTRKDAGAALLRLTLRLYHPLARRTLEPEAAASITDAMTPTVPPVVLEADADSFFPEDAETPRVQEMLAADGDFGRMRERIGAQVGIDVPVAQLLSRPGLGPGRYNVILDGSIAAAGTLGSESTFAPDLEECRRLGIDGRVDVDPLDETGPGGLWLAAGDETGGVWLAPGDEAPAELEVLDRYGFVVRHLEAVLQGNLDLFFGIEQAAAAFAAAGMDATPAALVRMAAVSRALLREGVPMTAPAAVAAAVAGADAEGVELPALVERVRESLASALPGADGSRPLVSVRHDIEDAVAQCTQRRDGKTFVAIPSAKLAELRRQIDEQVAGLEHGAALVVRPRGLRRFVRRVVELDHPAVPVLAFTELPPDVQLKVKEAVPAPAQSVEVVA